ncbi:diguanylate cyclase [Pseudoalteromonas sp. SSDWG2]|uniref:diguanylate cyclase n=1 Tax=Pseudoalteromonas sp. SSDWG2 TaxID=3139391 RepID=UPI003BAC8762
MRVFFSFYLLSFFACLASCFSLSSYAQTRVENIPLNHYFAETWDTRDGLPHNSINALTQTEDGYIWVGTWEGVARFNGRAFTLFTRGTQTGLPDSGIRSLSVEPRSQAMYVAGSRGGVSVVQHGQWQSLSPARNMVNYAFRASDGVLWLALEDDGVIRRDAEQEQHLLSSLSTYHIIEQDARIWIATSHGLYAYEEGELISPDNLPNALTGMIYKLALDSNNNLLVGCEQGLWRLQNGRFELLDSALKNEPISALLLDYRGDIWFGTINNGVFRYSEFGIEKLDANVGLPSNRILSLLEDNEHSIWIGTNAGLFRLRQAPFTTLSQSRGLSGNYVRTLLSHTDGNLYIGTSNGLNLYQGNTAQPLGMSDGSTISVLSLTSSRRGGIYVGTYTNGLLYFEDGVITPLHNRSNGLPSNEVRAIYEQEDGSLWIGTAAGLVHQRADGQRTILTDKQGLPGNFIMAIAQDSVGRIWVGTGVGVAYIDSETDTIVDMALSDYFDAEYAFGFLVERESLWMATDRGLVHVDLKTLSMSKLSKEQGLPVDKIFAVVGDEFDHFWLTSNRGVIRVARDAVLASLSDTTQVIEFSMFDQGDGMLSSQANGGSQYPALRHHDNTIWVATARGAVMVDPKRLTRMADTPLPVSIESIQFDSQLQPYALDKAVSVPADVNRVSFAYAGLGFVMTERIEYQTRLQGYEKQWVDRGNLAITEYTNLSPGHYQFEVRARYPYGPWQQNGAQISFIVAPKVWQTIPFKVALFTVIGLLIVLIYRLRFYHLKRSEARLKQRVAEQTKVLAEQAEAFAHQATHDQLTGIANRRAFDAWLTEHFVAAKAKGQALSLLIIDIDHFKKINDQFSHLVGDKVIIEVVNVIAKNLPPEALFSRWGGEEFAILLPHVKETHAVHWAQGICTQVHHHDYTHIDERLSVSISIGVADINSATNYDRLLSNADTALYQAKNKGRNRIVGFSSDCS